MNKLKRLNTLYALIDLTRLKDKNAVPFVYIVKVSIIIFKYFFLKN